MKIVIAPDSFKESLTATQVTDAIARAFAAVLPDADLVLLPVADGGEGTVDAMVRATGGHFMQACVTDPLGKPIMATWGLLDNGRTAVIETAAASGLQLVPPPQRNPLYTSSRGTGELIRHALDTGVGRIILGLGGSATNDAGAGLLMALGVRLLTEHGQSIPEGGAGLAELRHIDASGLDPRLAAIELLVACDVDNPLLGERGASAVFGPQKGADAAMVQRLDACLGHFATLIQASIGHSVADQAGAGAAGGIGTALLGFMQPVFRRGIDCVLDACHFDQQVMDADWVITGEGKIDTQTLAGKTILGVSERAQRFEVPVLVLAGTVSGLGDQTAFATHGVTAVFSITPGIISLAQAIAEAEANVYRTAYNIAQLIAQKH